MSDKSGWRRRWWAFFGIGVFESIISIVSVAISVFFPWKPDIVKNHGSEVLAFNETEMETVVA